MDLSQAITQYLSRQRNEKALVMERNLQLFARWCGPDRPVKNLIPADVENYPNAAAVATGDKQTHLNIVKGFLTYLKREALTIGPTGEVMNLASHVKIPRSARNNVISTPITSDAIAMTAAGQAAIKNELIELKGQRVNVAEAIRLAAADKDFKENAPLDAAREAQGKMEARIKEIEETLTEISHRFELPSVRQWHHIKDNLLHYFIRNHVDEPGKYYLTDYAQGVLDMMRNKLENPYKNQPLKKSFEEFQMYAMDVDDVLIFVILFQHYLI